MEIYIYKCVFVKLQMCIEGQASGSRGNRFNLGKAYLKNGTCAELK